ncbi:RNA polymerase sigma-70 factor (ECF subfamily) [Anaerosolibacter carboniphilus]|uniref:RNA polymerase sigma-70 factor (ECF subfamily) n=1 Tax=Anaerosolibacter carboniphilus TaxID=1417629 RepID=A0A841KLZ6_9FIRM|nr:sigma-70 family RNA polymerase sigma factor [Anaerosolibacter carboniphilus]MBB6214467.1 RNA polymerase sigma-70 factor (ECF subfamily) [Anaerosolibacter carboniphilus]
MQQFAGCNSLGNKEIQENHCMEEEAAYIFETYYKRVYNYIYYRVSCRYTAEDLASQVFEKIMLKINTYSGGKAPFEVWLFAIVRNVVNDYFRSQKKNKLFSIDTLKEFISREKTPETIIVAAETNDKLLQALDTLDVRERNMIALKFGADLKNREIAEVLDITESNVGVILYRAMRKLKKEIESEG